MAEQLRQPRKGFWFNEEMTSSFGEERAKRETRKSEAGELPDSDGDTVTGRFTNLDDFESSST